MHIYIVYDDIVHNYYTLNYTIVSCAQSYCAQH